MHGDGSEYIDKQRQFFNLCYLINPIAFIKTIEITTVYLLNCWICFYYLVFNNITRIKRQSKNVHLYNL